MGLLRHELSKLGLDWGIRQRHRRPRLRSPKRSASYLNQGTWHRLKNW
jgi:hypothetical protein